MTKLCHINELSMLGDRDCCEFIVELDEIETAVFIVKDQDSFIAYINSCPHTGARLNWQPNVFLDDEKRYIQCSIHGALFRVEDGYCLRGPCVRQQLSRVKLQITSDYIYIT